MILSKLLVHGVELAFIFTAAGTAAKHTGAVGNTDLIFIKIHTSTRVS
jgi:hypothetical protein